MKLMKFSIERFCSILLTIIIITSCRETRQSSFAKNNNIINGQYEYYFNDSVKLNLRFFGGHQPVDPPLANYNKHTPTRIKAFLKREFKHSEKRKILFYSYSPWKQFGFYYIGFLQKHLPIQHFYKKKTSTNNSVFFEEEGLEKVDSFLLKKYIIPLEQKDFIFYCFKKILYGRDIDSSTLTSDTHKELKTLKTLSDFKPYNKTTKDFSDSVSLALYRPGYGAPLNALLKLKRGHKTDEDFGILNQFLNTAYGLLDEVDTVKQLLYEQHTFEGNNIKNRTSDTIKVDNQLAIPKILEEATHQKVIMINESHYDWRHRYFVTLLLDSLFKKGYKYLCMEALGNEEDINKRNFSTSDDGYYLKEPFMANLANTALKIGYKLIEYEDTTSDLDAYLFNSPVDKREYNQALNLYRRYKKDTAAKWLVYAGYSHINKSSFSSVESSTMAKYFFELSHVDPYSINQSFYCDIFNTKVPVDPSGTGENYYYLRKDQISDSTLLQQSNLYIINNIDSIPYEKPGNIDGVGKYHIHYNSGRNENYFIQVFLKENYFRNHHSVPVYLKRSSEDIFDKNVWLPNNNYYLIVTDENDQMIYNDDLMATGNL